ncbi:flagellar basal body-associated FliL family protein [Jannaschia ovalis]|uniref:Flagellar protein FliL n=1 Tax=Jannaschia ovalis TaxID=3038773 RepID=A0ABY8LFU5_9RHOB|nr:flagellar basal body-associated FliL family protein [Jannaschia sp. GRR-S6-38]WGH80167.1 flagellar basal body-associated FliL family protein [Jannaschia sp. GRR-S6-38]
MAETDSPDSEDDGPKRGGKLKWILVGVGVLAAGGGGFYTAFSGALDAILPGAESAESALEEAAEPLALAFLPLDPITVTVGGPETLRNLRFRAQLQVSATGMERAETVRPRIADIATTYLRAVPMEVLESPTALLRVRAQLLRRVQLLAGPGTVEDLLVSEFVIN